MSTQKTYTVQEFAGLAGKHPDTVRRWIREQKIEAAQLKKYNQYSIPHSQLKKVGVEGDELDSSQKETLEETRKQMDGWDTLTVTDMTAQQGTCVASKNNQCLQMFIEEHTRLLVSLLDRFEQSVRGVVDGGVVTEHIDWKWHGPSWDEGYRHSSGVTWRIADKCQITEILLDVENDPRFGMLWDHLDQDIRGIYDAWKELLKEELQLDCYVLRGGEDDFILEQHHEALRRQSDVGHSLIAGLAKALPSVILATCDSCRGLYSDT